VFVIADVHLVPTLFRSRFFSHGSSPHSAARVSLLGMKYAKCTSDGSSLKRDGRSHERIGDGRAVRISSLAKTLLELHDGEGIAKQFHRDPHGAARHVRTPTQKVNISTYKFSSKVRIPTGRWNESPALTRILAVQD